MESRLHGASIEVDAPYLAEMVRNDMQNKYGDAVYTAGYKVYTTLDSRLQAAGTVALRTGLIEYDMRHGYRGASAKVDMSKIGTPAQFDAQLEEFPIIGGLKPAIVQQVEAKSAKIYVKDLGLVTLPWERLVWARRELPDEKVDRPPTQASEILNRGDVIYTVGRAPESLLYGPVRLRDALVHSRNLVSVRLMRAIGGQYTRDYVTRFGFDKSQLPDDLTLALGTAELSPLQVAIGYSTFANGGFKVSSYYIDRIEDAGGKVLQQANPAIACAQCGHPIDGPSPRSAAAAARAALDEAPHDGKTLISVKNLAPQILRPQIAFLLADMM